MKLRRISVSGFKTFARRSDVLLESGVTAVVGPNGSGKSNLVDAIRWALGETNARELRGARMDEVIYSGGQGKGPMGMAEVELVIDNEDGRLPFEEPEVSVSRRVTRGGSSEYRLNGESVRLRDLERVLGATGLTQSGYAVVAQNDIDGIIQATPLQRRVLIEQAAGVRSLRAASDDALQKVGKVEIKLLRMDDLLAEAEPRLAELEGEAAAAAEALELTERLQQLRGSLAREEWRAARGQVKQARNRVQGALSRAEAAALAQGAFVDRLTQQQDVLTDARRQQKLVAERLETARVGAERAAGDLRRWADRQMSGTLQRALARQEWVTAVGDAELLDEEALRLKQAFDDQTARREGLEFRLGAARSAHEEASQAVRAAAATVAHLEEMLDAAVESHRAAEATIRDQGARADLLDEALGGLAGEVEAAHRQAAALSRLSVEASHASEAQAATLVAADAAATEARLALATARDVSRDAQTVAGDMQREASHCGAHAAGLRGQIEAALGTAGLLARAIREGTISGRRLVDCFTVDEGDAVALEAALESQLGAWVVDDPDAAMTHLDGEGAREEVLGAGLPVADQPQIPACVRSAFATLIVEPMARGALAYCLATVWLAPDRETARVALDVAGGRAILPDGTVITSAGVRGGGKPGGTIALSAAEHRAIEAANTAEAAAASAAQRAASSLAALGEAEAAAEEAVRLAADARHQAAEASAASSSAATAARAEDTRAAALEAARIARLEERDRARGALAEALQARDVAGEALSTAREGAEAERVAQRQRRLAAEDAARSLRAVEMEAEQLRLAIDDLARRQVAAAGQAEATGRRALAAELRLLSAEGELITAVARSRAAGIALVDASALVTAVLAAVEASVAPVLGAEASVQALERERSEVAVAVARAEDERASAEAELAAAEARVTELAEAVREDCEDEGPEPDAQAAEKAEREIVRLERRISGFGPVNALAPGQFASLRARVEQLRADRGDLAGACGDIRALVSDLSTEIERRFDQVFGAVSFHFHVLYEELFPGGRATLRLEQPAPPDADVAAVGDDGAEIERPGKLAGVEILAQPAGKRLQPLTLLSGGERALTALAVILALQQVNPSPFYLFDEVDAPLDDSNVGRFTKLLKRLAETQQFMVVTHNHATMASADAMYGVTIDREGVSNVLSVRFVGDHNGGVVAPGRPAGTAAVG